MSLKNYVAVLMGILCLGVVSDAYGGGKQQTGFLDKVYTAPDGYEAKYVVFVPHAYDGKKVFPLILFLHGAGLSGKDGRRQTNGALAKAIRKQEKEFAFITVFPAGVRLRLAGWFTGGQTCPCHP